MSSIQPPMGGLDRRALDIKLSEYREMVIVLFGYLGSLPTLFTRKDAGIRFLTGTSVGIGLLIFGAYLGFFGLASQNVVTCVAYLMFFGLVSIAATVQLVRNSWRANVERRGGYTRFMGRSHLQPILEPLNAWLARHPLPTKYSYTHQVTTWLLFLIETLLVIAFGLFILILDRPLGLFIFECGVALGFQNLLIHTRGKEIARDDEDARHIAELRRQMRADHVEPRVISEALVINEAAELATHLQQNVNRQHTFAPPPPPSPREWSVQIQHDDK